MGHLTMVRANNYTSTFSAGFEFIFLVPPPSKHLPKDRLSVEHADWVLTRSTRFNRSDSDLAVTVLPKHISSPVLSGTHRPINTYKPITCALNAVKSSPLVRPQNFGTPPDLLNTLSTVGQKVSDWRLLHVDFSWDLRVWLDSGDSKPTGT